MNYTETLVFASNGHSHYRIPSIVVTQNGTVLAFCNDRRDTVDDHAKETDLVMARKERGQEWSPVRVMAHVDGWACTIGSAVYDENTGTAFCSGLKIPVTRYEFGRYTEEEKREFARLTEEKIKAAGVPAGDFLLFSTDDGCHWQERVMNIQPCSVMCEDGRTLSVRGCCHGSGAGITLRHGRYAGRVLCPSRMATGEYHDMDGLRKHSCNNAIYSDDHGATWKTAFPVQAGTGEGTLIEDGEGRVLYNSRAYFEDRKRYLAISEDGGEHFGDFHTDDFLLDTAYMGCNASFLRVDRSELSDPSLLPDDADGITVFVNPRSEGRDHLTACLSFDSGRTWKGTKLIHEGRSAYSSLAFSRMEHQFYLLFETGENDPYDRGIVCAVFDLEWLLSSMTEENE